METAKQATIEINNLKKTFYDSSLIPFRKSKQITALDGVSLRVKPGEVVALVGRNGAGKTTLMKILATLVIPTSGQVRIGDADVVIAPERAKAMIGLATGDERSFYWRITGRQNLDLFAALYNIPRNQIRKRVNEVIQIMNLTPNANQTFKSYSTGIRQRLALARCLLHDPPVLLLDEPTHGLDPVMKSRLLNLLRNELAIGAGKTILFATHQLSDATEAADRIAILDRGKLLAELPAANAEEAKKILLQAETDDT
jgi:ABC-2 type transport system ATP-binding protein